MTIIMKNYNLSTKVFSLIFLILLSVQLSIVDCQQQSTSNKDGQQRTSSSGGADSTKLKPQASSKISLININEDDWEQMLQGEWMVEFHAPWCPACRALQPEWKTFSTWSSDLGIKVGAVDVTSNPGLSGRFIVTALPTIYHVKDGVFRQFTGTRDSNTFVSFIEDKKWQSIEPVSSWKAPNSIPMSIVSYFFKVSMALRSIHNSLVEDYGIPYWGSYILFAFATILFGAILGLMIVCLIDLIFPAKTPDEILRRPTAQGDLIDDTEDMKGSKQYSNERDDDETEEDDYSDDERNSDRTDEDEIEDDDYDEDEDSPKIQEIDDDGKAIEDNSSPQQSNQRNVRLRKARRD